MGDILFIGQPRADTLLQWFENDPRQDALSSVERMLPKPTGLSYTLDDSLRAVTRIIAQARIPPCPIIHLSVWWSIHKCILWRNKLTLTAGYFPHPACSYRAYTQTRWVCGIYNFYNAPCNSQVKFIDNYSLFFHLRIHETLTSFQWASRRPL
jgi:hypothetical protein